MLKTYVKGGLCPRGFKLIGVKGGLRVFLDLINIYVNIPLYLINHFNVSSRNSENDLKCSLRGEHVLRENGGPWPRHGRTPPRPWGHGQAKTYNGKRGMGSTTCRLPTIGHKQRTSTCKAMHGHAQGSAQACAGQLKAVHRQRKTVQQ